MWEIVVDHVVEKSIVSRKTELQFPLDMSRRSRVLGSSRHVLTTTRTRTKMSDNSDTKLLDSLPSFEIRPR